MNKTTLAVVGAVGSALALVALVAASHFTKPEKLDALGCSADIPGKTVIVLDTSDVVAEQTRSEIVDRVRTAIRNNVRDGELVSVFTVSELSKKNLTPVFAYCKP